jgi:hypothetical protein
MGNVAGRRRHVLQRIEILAPLFGDGIRIVEIVLVKLFDERRIAAEQLELSKSCFIMGDHLALSCFFVLAAVGEIRFDLLDKTG